MVRQSQFANEFEDDLIQTAKANEMVPSTTNDLRRRNPQSTNADAKKVSTKVEIEDKSSSVISVLDILRVIVSLVGISLAASYYVTSGESFIFGQPRPWFTKPAQLKHYFKGPINLTVKELAKFDGSDPSSTLR